VALEIKATFTAAQAYVMFSRVEDISQVVIMDSISESDIKTEQKAIQEMNKMNERSRNSNPSPWMKKSMNTIKVAALNVMNLKNNLKDVAKDPTLTQADIINLSETWITSQDNVADLQIEGYQASFNSVGKGKGIMSFFKPDVFSPDSVTHHQLPGAQISKYESDNVDVIHVYRSQDQPIAPIMEIILSLLNLNKTMVVCGDFNICLKKSPNNSVTQELTSMGMVQLTKEATHIAGGHIDHMYLNKTKPETTAVQERYSPYYTDHDALCLTLAGH
jgi:exonuclease III